MTTHVNKLLYSEDATGLNHTLLPTDTYEVTPHFRFTGPVEFRGTVQTTVREEVRVSDNHIMLNDAYTAAPVVSGGLVIATNGTGLSDTVAATGFVAAVVATSNATIATVGTATFAANDLIEIKDAFNPDNNGLYEVLSHVGTLLTIRGVGLTNTVLDVTETDLTTDTTVAGTIHKVNIVILRTNLSSPSLFESGSGSTNAITFTSLSSSTSGTLQSAYDNDADGGDAIITTNATDGAVKIAGTEKLWVTAVSGLDVDTLADFDVTTFDVQMTGTNGWFLRGTATSLLQVTAGDLQVRTLTSGLVDVDGVDGVRIDSSAGSIGIGTDANAFAIDIGTGAAARTITYGNLTGATAQVFNTGTGGFLFRFQTGDADGYRLWDGTNTYILADSTAGKEQTQLPQFNNISGGAGLEFTANEALAIGELVKYAATGEVAKADAVGIAGPDFRDAYVVGVNRFAVVATAVAQIYTVPGSLVQVLFSAAPAAVDNGKIVYLSETPGQGTLTPPVGAFRVRYKVGILWGADGADTTPTVLFQPEFISATGAA